jgi:hypothetical protein
MTWYHDHKGKPSTMRILAMMGGVLGSVICIAGTVGFFLRIPDAVMLVTVGAGLIGAGEIAKGWQGRAE